MNGTYEFMSAALIKKAEANGIPYKTLHSRLRAGWSEERAATEKTQDLFGTWKPVLAITKIPKGTFYNRYYRGMTPFEAATTPNKGLFGRG
jgi:hypothetical protein